MSLSSSPSPVKDPALASEEERADRRAMNGFRISLVIALLMAGIAVIAILVSAIPRTDYFEAMQTGFLVIMGLISAWLCRRKRTNLGVLLLTVGLWMVELSFPLVTHNQAIAVALLILLIVWYLASSALPPRWLPRVIIVGIAVSIAAILIDISRVQTVLQGRADVTIPITVVAGAIFLFFILRQFRTYALRTKMILMFLAVALVPLAALSYLSISSTSTIETRDVETKLTTTAQQGANAIDVFIKGKLDDIRFDTLNSSFRDFLSLSEAERASMGDAVQSQLLALAQKDRIYIASIALLDRNGVNLVDTDSAGIGVDESRYDYYKYPLYVGLPYVSDVLFPESVSGFPSLFFSSPVRSVKGDILGVLRLRYNAAILQGMLKKELGDAGEGLHTILFDDIYFMRLAHSQSPELVFKTIVPMGVNQIRVLQAAERMPPGQPETLKSNQPEFVAGLQNVSQQPFFSTGGADLGGNLEIGTAVSLKQAPWMVVARQSQAIAFQPVQAQTRTAVLWALVASILAALAAVGASQLLSAPIVHLTGIAEHVASGDLNARARVETQDEIGTLTTTFNSMTSQLQQTLQGLERRVAERTRAIELTADVSRRLSTILDPARLVSEVVELVQFAFNYYHVHIYLWDDNQENLVMVGGSGEPGKVMLQQGHKIARGKGLVGQSCELAAPVLVADTAQDPNWLPNPLLPETKSEIAIPIMLGEQVLGALDVQQNVVGGLGQQDSDMLRAIANQVAIALYNARQYSDAQRKAERETLMNSIVQQIQSAQTVESALQVAVRELGRSLKAPLTRAKINLGEGGNGRNEA